jgi:hypothetical protein
MFAVNATPSVQFVLDDTLTARREVEFAQALDRFLADYALEQRQRLQTHSKGQVTGHKVATEMMSLRQLDSFIIEALKRLGDAMTGEGRYPPVGIM